MVQIVYIHGFMSSGKGGKYEALKRRYRRGFNILSPSFSDSIKTAEKQLNALMDTEEMNSEGIICLIGTSLGGFYARYLASVYKLRAILINPVLNPSTHMKKYEGITLTNFKTGHTFLFTREDLATLASMEKKIRENLDDDSVYLPVIASRDDVIDRDQVEKEFDHITYVDDDHQFNNAFEPFIRRPEVRKFITDTFGL
jgi:predicted esterase YcpF (UPF0227 family)